jgi:hypothetical protein
LKGGGNLGHAAPAALVAPDRVAESEFERIAIDGCVKAFFEDFNEICQKETVVLLFDSWDADRANAELRKWIQFNLLLPHCFDVVKRPERLVIVIAAIRNSQTACAWGPFRANSMPSCWAPCAASRRIERITNDCCKGCSR